jgi:hypothetical protein
MDSSVWHLFTNKNISDYTAQMLGLLHTIKSRVSAACWRCGAQACHPCFPSQVQRCHNRHQDQCPLCSWLLPCYLQVPPSTTLVWLSPPPRHAIKAPHYVDLPAEWIRLYNRVAVDLGFTYPAGPAHHLDLYTLALGEMAGIGCISFYCLLGFRLVHLHACR